MKENVLRRKKDRREREREQKLKRPLGQPLVDRPKTPMVVLIRMFLIGSVAVIASIWAIWRHYYAHPRMPLLIPTPVVTAPSTSASEIEIEVPPPQ